MKVNTLPSRSFYLKLFLVWTKLKTAFAYPAAWLRRVTRISLLLMTPMCRPEHLVTQQWVQCLLTRWGTYFLKKRCSHYLINLAVKCCLKHSNVTLRRWVAKYRLNMQTLMNLCRLGSKSSMRTKLRCFC